MREKQVRQQTFRMLRLMGYWPITQTDLNAPFDVSKVQKLLHTLIGVTKKWPHVQGVVFALRAVLEKAVARPPIGRPDILVLHPRGQSLVTEVKALMPDDTSLSFKCVTPEQHTWLDAWMSAGGLGYLTIGVIRPARSRTKLVRLYMVAWKAWCEAEQQIKPIQGSIPLVAGKGMRKELQVNRLDIVTLLQPYELERRDGRWWLPEGHSAQIEEVHSGTA